MGMKEMQARSFFVCCLVAKCSNRCRVIHQEEHCKEISFSQVSCNFFTTLVA